ncbi:hypothetical protein ACTFIY_004762 [Dictyostelium cf. discoideum]
MIKIIEKLDIEYLNTGKDGHKLDLYYQDNDENNENRPLFVYVHGGFWVDRDKKGYSGLGHYFAQEMNVAVAIVNYRLSSKDINKPEVLYPNHNEDLVQSLIWLIENNKDENTGKPIYSNKKIVLMGHSVGGHMITLVGLEWEKYIDQLKLDTCKKSYKQSLIGFIGVQGLYNLKGFYEDFPNYKSDITLGFGTDDPNKWYDTVSVNEIINNNNNNNNIDYTTTQSWMIVHSPDDPWVNNRQSVDCVNHLKDKLSFKNVILEQDLNDAHFEVIDNLGNKLQPSADKFRQIIKNFFSNYIFNK